MPRLVRNALSARMVRCAAPGSYVDGNGLMLRVRASGARSWVQRLMVHGRRVDVKRVLRPLALAGKHATARVVAGRIVAVLEWAEVENLREPAGSGRAAVETVMRSLPKAAEVRHHRALHFSDVAAALARVDGHPRIGRVVQLAIRFGVLTAARQGEVRQATWDEFDLGSAVWTVPAASVVGTTSHSTHSWRSTPRTLSPTFHHRTRSTKQRHGSSAVNQRPLTRSLARSAIVSPSRRVRGRATST